MIAIQLKADVIFSSQTDMWETPQYLFDELDREFHFGIDACATPENAKCENFFTQKEDGLKQKWGGVRNNLVQSSVWQANLEMGEKGKRRSNTG